MDCLGVCSWKAWLCVSVTEMGGMLGGGRNPEEHLEVMHRPASCCFSLLLQVSFDCLRSLLAWMPSLGLIWLSGLAFLRLPGAGDMPKARLMLPLWLSQGGGDSGACTDS